MTHPIDPWLDLVAKYASIRMDAVTAAMLTNDAQTAGFFNDYYERPDLWTDEEAKHVTAAMLAQHCRDQQFMASRLSALLYLDNID